MNQREEKPLVYACSGCSSAAQTANKIALKMDRNDVAEMSCIAGVGGDVRPLVKTATSGRPIIAIDGCPLQCAKHCLKRHDVTPVWHVDLSTYAIKKQKGVDPVLEEVERTYTLLLREMPKQMNG